MKPSTVLSRSRLLLGAAKTRAPTLARARGLRRQTGTEPGRRPTLRANDLHTAPEPSGPASDAPPPVNPPEVPQDEPEAPSSSEGPTKTRISRAKPDVDAVELPEGLDILWTPEEIRPSMLPPPEIFDEALNNLHIALHPHTQHKATYASPASQQVEPTLALYCPIEGGDHIIDATVGELAIRTGAEVLVLDSVQLAAGEWGSFGEAANSLQLPSNPLHFSSYSNTSSQHMEEDDGDEQWGGEVAVPRQMAFTIMSSAIPNMLGGPNVVGSSSRRAPKPISKSKVFFDALVNMPSKQTDASDPTKTRPRLIYVRDFPTLAPTSGTWYPHLLSAVRQRRKGPISRPSSPVSAPMTIIFGMSPSIAPPSLPNSAGPGSGMMNVLLDRSTSSSRTMPPPKVGRDTWAEDEIAEQHRDRRLRNRLKKWEKDDKALLEDIPKLSTSEDSNTPNKPEMVILGMPFAARSMSNGGQPQENESTSFFRTSVIVPSTRSPTEERNARMSRRREINELTMRMAVGAIGGGLEASIPDIPPPLDPEPEDQIDGTTTTRQPTNHQRMWEDWGQRVEAWSNVRHVADHAVGSVAAGVASQSDNKASLERSVVPWSSVHDSWAAFHGLGDVRTNWLKAALPASKLGSVDEEAVDDTSNQVDEVVERVKSESDLDPHEQRLLPTIVDRTTMPTSFGQVHLPHHTIDSIRTIVSLPLLYPSAFQEGILKEHGMTGCLLFGPPGTGKTLVVRALAREAGCRMMVVSPSDVMDMYVGEGEKLVKSVFSLARRLSPCVVFLDEIDALLGARMSARGSGGAFAHRGVITEFMQEMDGLKSSKDDRVIVIGATNRPFDLDDAVLRRLPRRLLVDLPGPAERQEILKILLRNEQLSDDIDIVDLSQKTETFSGSDLKHLCVSAALDAVKEGVVLPWNTLSPSELPPNTKAPSEPESEATQQPRRTISQRNFLKALKEITPSSSESLGSLAELRKWNEEFGEGRKDRRRKQVWGKDRFGFTNVTKIPEPGRVQSAPDAGNTSSDS